MFSKISKSPQVSSSGRSLSTFFTLRKELVGNDLGSILKKRLLNLSYAPLSGPNLKTVSCVDTHGSGLNLYVVLSAAVQAVRLSAYINQPYMYTYIYIFNIYQTACASL